MISIQAENIIIQKISGGNSLDISDLVAVEEPLEIAVEYSTTTGRMQKNISVNMRTPGNDEELAAGFLFTEAVIPPGAIVSIKNQAADKNRMLVTLKESIMPALNHTTRNFFSSSGCGICGKASIEAIKTVTEFSKSSVASQLPIAVIYSLQQQLKSNQTVFNNTGGLHASAIFNLQGNLLLLKEDIGRHNALDKIIGDAYMKNKLPLNNCILFLSGRSSFELIQKAVMAGIQHVVAVGAPSSLAVEMAREHGITLIGFLKEDRFNIYSGKERIDFT